MSRLGSRGFNGGGDPSGTCFGVVAAHPMCAPSPTMNLNRKRLDRGCWSRRVAAEAGGHSLARRRVGARRSRWRSRRRGCHRSTSKRLEEEEGFRPAAPGGGAGTLTGGGTPDGFRRCCGEPGQEGALGNRWRRAEGFSEPLRRRWRWRWRWYYGGGGGGGACRATTQRERAGGGGGGGSSFVTEPADVCLVWAGLLLNGPVDLDQYRRRRRPRRPRRDHLPGDPATGNGEPAADADDHQPRRQSAGDQLRDVRGLRSRCPDRQARRLPDQLLELPRSAHL